ncbi:MAG: phosphotransferase [Chloroflexi bacterium]|nr:phosphotransferase [Chloroflexota bacterium]
MTKEESTLPAVFSLLQTEPLLEAVADAYGIEGAVRATLLRSWTNDVYQIEAKAQRYILKVYRRGWRSPEEVGWEVELQSYLAARAIAAPVIPRRDGGLFGTVQAPEGVRALALFGYASGVKPEPPLTPALYHSFGRGAAELHRASADFTSQCSRFAIDLAALIDRPLGVIQPWLADRPEDWSFIVQVATTVREKLHARGTADLDWGVVQGDLSLDNVHVTADHRVVFYDFDAAAYGWRAWDVTGVRAYQPRENWDAFLAGYREVRSFGEADVAVVPYFVVANALQMMAGEIERWTAWFGTLRVVAWVNDTLIWLRHWVTNYLPAA